MTHANPRPQARDDGRTSPSRIRIAIAEDNVDVRKALASLLSMLGHEVACEVGDGEQLLRACAEMKDTVDLVIADLDMPVMDGLEAAEEFSKRGIPVILLSGHPDIEQVKVEHEPVAARLSKPATPEKLTAAIRAAVGSVDATGK
jgi:CheY-like chemotaxis protein